MSTNKQILEVLDILTGAFPERALDEKMVHSYQIGLEDLDGNTIIRAATEIIKDGSIRFFPRIGELRSLARKIKLRGDRHQDAWCEMRDRLFKEFWKTHPKDYPGFDMDFHGFALSKMPADLVRMEAQWS